MENEQARYCAQLESYAGDPDHGFPSYPSRFVFSHAPGMEGVALRGRARLIFDSENATV